jgi:small-conductance mechanosensitive channel
MVKKITIQLAVFLASITFIYLVSACGSAPTPVLVTPTLETPTTTAATTTPPNATDQSVAISNSGSPTPEGTSTALADGSSGQAAVSAVAARTPLPTPTSGPIDRGVAQITDRLGLTGGTFLGLTSFSWINLAISSLMIIVGYLAVSVLMNRLLKRLVKRSAFQLDDQILSTIENPLKWLIVAFITRFSLLRLVGLNEGLRTFLDDVFFIAILVLASVSAARLISFFTKWYTGSLKSAADAERLAPLVTIIQRIGYFFLLIFAISIGLDHFGFNITLLAAILLLVGGLITLGARETVQNVVNGFLILIDQPFRVGDDILISDLNTWGTVMEIGTHTTRIRTRDNREVIVPNAKIGQSQVTNYSLPDPSFRAETQIGVAYGSDFDLVRKVITEAVQSVDGVLPDKSVSIYFSGFGDSARLMKVRWWIASRRDMNPILDRVNEALELTLTKAGIVLPNNTMDLNVSLSGSQSPPQQSSETGAK